ncbi:MAG: sulfotransferase domain-containing protein [Bacteroidia bacterium]|nr:sulfotransferase domain-containing protein [Bacteroidia bacterium]
MYLTDSLKKKVLLFERVNQVLYRFTGLKIYPVKSRLHEIRADDKMIVSYPRSGNTWTRFLVANLINKDDKPLTFNSYWQNVASIEDFKLSNRIDSINSPRILKSHDVFDPRYKKVVYLVRDPRSVAVSYYYLLKRDRRIPENIIFKDYLKDFIQGNYSQGMYSNFGSWEEHVGSWIGGIGHDDNRFLIIKYEDLRANTNIELKKIANFFDLSNDDDQIEKAIEYSSMENMKNFSNQRKELHEKMKIDTSIPFIRKGSADEWKEHFDEESLSLLYDKFGPIMNKVGYDTEN